MRSEYRPECISQRQVSPFLTVTVNPVHSTTLLQSISLERLTPVLGGRAGGGKRSACRPSSATAPLGARGREAGSETCVSVPYTWEPAGKKQVPKCAFLFQRLQAHGWLVARVVMARVVMARVGMASDGSGSDGSCGDG